MKKKIDETPFDRKKRPVKQNLLAMPFLWSFSYFITKRAGLKIHKVNMKGLKPPFLVLGTHHSFMDFYVTPMALFPYRANYISELEGFEAFGEWKYRQAGCLGTRKFVDDMALIENIKYVVDDNRIIVIYPEARYCNVGTSSPLMPSVGKLVKLLKAPVVTLNMKGNYLQSPIWNLKKRKEVRLEAEITKVLTPEQIKQYSPEQIIAILQPYLDYDEYQWQFHKKMAITYEKRAEGLHMPLYHCPACKKEFEMRSQSAQLFCDACKKRWHLDEYGRLRALSGETEFSHIPDWYEYQREEVKKEIDEGRYLLDMTVSIQALPNAKNFIDLGQGRVRHDRNGFQLLFRDGGKLCFSPQQMTSIHTEYDYRGKGQCITLSTVDNTYFLFPKEQGFNATKIQFATEYLYECTKSAEKSK